jgi:hypothetical protein
MAKSPTKPKPKMPPPMALTDPPKKGKPKKKPKPGRSTT